MAFTAAVSRARSTSSADNAMHASDAIRVGLMPALADFLLDADGAVGTRTTPERAVPGAELRLKLGIDAAAAVSQL